MTSLVHSSLPKWASFMFFFLCIIQPSQTQQMINCVLVAYPVEFDLVIVDRVFKNGKNRRFSKTKIYMKTQNSDHT